MKRLALCIGNDEYINMPRLFCAENDAKSVSLELADLGFDVICLCNLDRAAMVDTITSFVERIEEYDSVLFYYAGHGCQIDGDNILAPTDLDINQRPAAIKINAFPLEELMRSLDKYPDKVKVFIFDACRTVLFDRGTVKGFAPVLAPQGSIIAFATSPGQSSSENTSTQHGYYTEALLNYIKLPRVNIETIFKKTREQLVARFGGKQIPWEHTSLIGDYYLNPNTIYDGVNYNPEALADSRYRSMSSYVREIIDGLKSHNWYTQGAALSRVSDLNFKEVTASDLFVIGRNIYQSADGSCFDAQSYINDFSSKKLPNEAKLHLLNGIAYEIYFTSNNTLRIHPKVGYYKPVIQLLEKDEFYGSKAFITSILCKVNNQILYIPGQNEIMEFVAEIDDKNKLQSLTYKGINVLYAADGKKYNFDIEYPIEYSIDQLTNEIACQVAAPSDCVVLRGLNSKKVCFPSSFTLSLYEVFEGNEF
jgi:Uncharacterized protein containing caspase domain